MAAAKTEPEVTMPDPEELVEVMLFQDEDRYRDPLFVSLNGESIMIQRGVPVKIKRKFKDIIDLSIASENAARRQRIALQDRSASKI